MKNDDSRSEKLAEWLSQTDDDLLDEAYSVDNAEKLKKRMGSEGIRAQTPFTRRPAFRGAVAAAACLAVTLGAVLTLPALLKTDDIIVNPKTSGRSDVVKPPRTDETTPNLPPQTGNFPNVEIPKENLRINSIDKLNYYSAVRILTDSSNSLLSPLSAGGRNSYEISLLSADLPYDPDNTPGPPVNQDPPEPSSPQPNDDPDIYYYEFDPDQVFYVHDVSFFRIELTDETGFLASKIGTGVADVVISEDFVFGDALITFKNGDRYFSCLHNSFHRDELTGRRTFRFSTHKYIEGFCVVKNFEQENYEFVVSFDGDQVDYFECAVWDKGENPDGVLPVVSETYVSSETFEYTITDLENYFNADKLSKQDWANGRVYQWGDYLVHEDYPFGEDFERKLVLAEFPDTVFIWREDSIFAYENGQERALASGMPLWNAYFTDLNGDGYPELCVTADSGSGIVDSHILVCDYHNDKGYYLGDRMEFDYFLFSKDGELYIRKSPYHGGRPVYDDPKAIEGKPAIVNGELVMKPCGEELVPIPDDTETPPSSAEEGPIRVSFYTHNQYVFELMSDGTFVFYALNESDSPFREGRYSKSCDTIEFYFYAEGEIVESAACDLFYQGFIYKGAAYNLTPMD